MFYFEIEKSEGSVSMFFSIIPPNKPITFSYIPYDTQLYEVTRSLRSFASNRKQMTCFERGAFKIYSSDRGFLRQHEHGEYF